MTREQAVQALVDAAAKVGCMCHSSDGTEWHAPACPIPALRAAILAVEQSGDGWVDVQKELPPEGEDIGCRST